MRALRPHIGARLPLPDGAFLGVLARARSTATTLAPAGGRVRTDGDRLLLDCNGGALELTEIQPPGGRARCAAADWLRGRPDPALTDFWLDPRLPGALARRADRAARARVGLRRRVAAVPGRARLARRRGGAGGGAASCSRRDDPRARGVAAYVLGQLGMPGAHASRRERRRARARWPSARRTRRCSPTIASAFGHLGAPYGLETLLAPPRATPTPRVREGAADALAGRDDERVVRRADRALRATPSRRRPRLGDVRARHARRRRTRRRCATRSPRGSTTATTSTRIEAVHGLALRGDARALDAALDLLGEVGPHDDGGNAADTIWKRYALTQATVRLAALTGDARLKEHLPALDERLMGTAIEGDLRTAYDRVGDQ